MVEEEEDIILPKSNPQSPFYTGIPVDSQPTETLSKRFELWRQILKSLINYFKCIIISNKEFSKINSNIVNQIHFPFFTNIKPKIKSILKHSNGSSSNINNKDHQLKPNFKDKIHKHTKSLSKSNLTPSTSATASSGHDDSLEEHFDVINNNILFEIVEPSIDNRKKQSFFNGFGNGSIQDLQVLLKKYHLNLSKQQLMISKELEFNVLPLLEDFQRDLFEKCKEIKLLSGDFKNSLNNEIAITGQVLNDYIQSIKNLENGNSNSKDPFLLKLRLELQLKQQLNQENYLEEAYVNLQTTGMKLEMIIYKAISDSLNKYGELISQEIFVYYNDLINELHQGLIDKPSYYEWDKFIDKTKGKVLIDLKHDQPIPKSRQLSDLKYPYNKSIISKTIRSGHFNKKSKFLKNYSKGFYLLTLSHLHEFKSSNLVENFEPIHSYNLNDCILIEINDHKFQLNILNHRDSGNIVFKKSDDMDEIDFKKWVLDLKHFTSFNTFSDRYNYYSAKHGGLKNRGNGTSSSFTSTKSSNETLMTRIEKFNLSNPNLNNKQISTSTSSSSTSIPTISDSAPISPQFMLSSNDSSALKPRLQISSVLPKFEIQEPSPLNTTAPIHSIIKSPSRVGHSTTPNRNIHSRPESPNNSSSNQLSSYGTGTPGVVTPMFEEPNTGGTEGGYFDMVKTKFDGNEFQLDQSLYGDELNKLKDEQDRLAGVLERLNVNQ